MLMLSSSLYLQGVADLPKPTKTTWKIERKLKVRAIQNIMPNAICIHMFQWSSFECWLTQTRASGWFVLTNFLNLSQGGAKWMSSIKFAGQVLWWYWWWSDICNVHSFTPHKIRPLRVIKHKETKISNCSDRCHKKEIKSERIERKWKSFSGMHRSFTPPVGTFFLLPYSLYRLLILPALSLPGIFLYGVHFEVSFIKCTYYSDSEPYKTYRKVEFSSPLQVQLWMRCNIVMIGESISGCLIRWTCLAQIKATLPTYVKWVGIDLTLHAIGAHVTWTESAHSIIFTHKLRWCASERIRLKTILVAENVAKISKR